MPNQINVKSGQLTEKEAQDLYIFLENQSQLGIKYWQKNKRYSVNGKVCTFTNDMFQREGKDGRYRYEVISSKELGQGSFGTVNLIKNTVTFDNEQIYFKKSSKKDGSRRVVKMQYHASPESFESLESEYQISTKATHLAVKKPILIEDKQFSLMRMKHLPGQELQSILQDDLTKKRVLTVAERMELTHALLKALQAQVIDKGIIHRDIKPGNILVDLGPPLLVNIIDYGVSISTPDGNGAGTPIYSAPEIFTNPINTSPKSDVYSMGRVLALLWGCNNETYNDKYGAYLFKNLPTHEILKGLFSRCGKLGKVERDIFDALANMLKHNPEERSDINNAIMAFASIKLEDIYRSQFHQLYKDIAEKERFSFLRNVGIKGHENLAEIILHAIKDNNRSRQICVELNWLKKNGALSDTAPQQIVEAYPKFNQDFNLK
ncbi:serine/threonine-protein kinase [Legionella beliardensis]|uniref:Serine/threonine-protein kinase n=1 Tax=Legionella beliardensis TaxID=91822 RepID=A0A378I2Q4_9GAMM|nr:protein kinase [Legionella beliardensis]STX29222.1 serine/threonine-protein kinase [Legionella beliardensis]